MASLITTVIWLGLLISTLAVGGAVETADEALGLAQLGQQWPGSVVNVINNIGYAVLGIPSIVYGMLLHRARPPLGLGGILLGLSGVASIIGLVGHMVQSDAISAGSIVSGGFFLLALIPLSRGFLQEGKGMIES